MNKSQMQELKRQVEWLHKYTTRLQTNLNDPRTCFDTDSEYQFFKDTDGIYPYLVGWATSHVEYSIQKLEYIMQELLSDKK